LNGSVSRVAMSFRTHLELAHLSNSTNVLFTVFLAESKILVEACGCELVQYLHFTILSTIPNRMLSPV
jgi:hypothetical protein